MGFWRALDSVLLNIQGFLADLGNSLRRMSRGIGRLRRAIGDARAMLVR